MKKLLTGLFMLMFSLSSFIVNAATNDCPNDKIYWVLKGIKYAKANNCEELKNDAKDYQKIQKLCSKSGKSQTLYQVLNDNCELGELGDICEDKSSLEFLTDVNDDRNSSFDQLILKKLTSSSKFTDSYIEELKRQLPEELAESSNNNKIGKTKDLKTCLDAVEYLLVSKLKASLTANMQNIANMLSTVDETTTTGALRNCNEFLSDVNDNTKYLLDDKLTTCAKDHKTTKAALFKELCSGKTPLLCQLYNNSKKTKTDSDNTSSGGSISR